MANLHTVAELKDSVSGILSGLDLANVSDLLPSFERAASNFLQKADVPEASGIQDITLYSGVTDYLISPTIYGTDLVDIRPQGVNRPSWDFVTKSSQSQFDRTKGYFANGTRAAFEYRNGVPVIRIVSSNVIPQIILDPMTSITGWTAAGTASGLVADGAVYYQSPSSLRFNLTGSGAGTLTKAISSSNLSTYQGVGMVFLAMNVPTVANLTSVTLKIGSDSSNYASVTQTASFLGAWVSNQWQLTNFDLSTAVNTGTPDFTAIDYIQVTFNHTGVETNIRVGDLFISQPSANQILYQSAAIFVPTGSTTASQNITADTDTVILNTPAYNIYLYECALAVLENTSGAAGDAMTERINRKLFGDGNMVKGLYQQFTGNNPSQQLRQLGTYYDNMPNWGWGSRGIGGN